MGYTQKCKVEATVTLSADDLRNWANKLNGSSPFLYAHALFVNKALFAEKCKAHGL